MLTIILIILVSITLLGVIFVILYTQLNKEPAAEPQKSIDEIVVSVVEVPELTTNLSDGKFVRLAMKIETNSEDAAIELTKRDFQTNNIIIQELSEMTVADLEGKQGKTAFQNTIKAQLNELMQDGEVEQVYITSYIIP